MISEAIKQLIGTSGAMKYYEVEKGAVRRFAEAVDDNNPLYMDEEYAENRNTPQLLRRPAFRLAAKTNPRRSAGRGYSPELEAAFEKAGYPLSLVLDGGMEYEFFLPVRAGDILSAVTTVRNLRERTGEGAALLSLSSIPCIKIGRRDGRQTAVDVCPPLP